MKPRYIFTASLILLSGYLLYSKLDTKRKLVNAAENETVSYRQFVLAKIVANALVVDTEKSVILEIIDSEAEKRGLPELKFAYESKASYGVCVLKYGLALKFDDNDDFLELSESKC